MTKTQSFGGAALLALAVTALAGCVTPASNQNQNTENQNSLVENQNSTAGATQTDSGQAATGQSANEQSVFDPAKIYTVSGHPEWPPIMWREGEKIVGAGPQLVEKIAQDLGFKVESKYAGLWDEVQKKAKSGEVNMLAAAYKTSERETYMDYSDAFTTDPIAIFVKKGKKFNYAKWDNLIGKKGIATVGDSYGQEFDDYIKAKLTVERVNTVDEAFRALENNKADYFIYSLYGGEKVLNEKKMKEKFEVLSKYLAEENFYITVSKKSPLTKFLPQINSLIKKYKEDGTIEKLIKENKQKSIGN
jgi:polar amino acid transport system substrate-binding protein